ncbi:hypothetical protein VTO73DRAFT_4355 [Trametes versicolor]
MIRDSPIQGINVPKCATALKATLFADDTTVYLAATDDFRELQNVLDTWCSAAKAKFNISKTEIIPIGTKEYRTEMAGTYQRTGKWENYPEGVHVAGDGEAVRILGAFMGNNVDQCGVWSTKLEKVRAVFERWKYGHSKLPGKKHTVQMMLGGMTQFLTDVQRMPDAVVKRFTKMMRNYVWDDKQHVPIATEHLYLALEEGGLNLLDLEARNDAIDVMWLKAYLNLGEDRPMWALLADDLFALNVPSNATLKEEDLRINTFLQRWSPKMKGLPDELRALLKCARKFGLRQEGIAFSRSILREMPMWDHAHVVAKEMSRLTVKSAVMRCLKKNHGLRVVGDFEELANTLLNRNHRPVSTCTCEDCELQITRNRCANPHRCCERAKRILDLLPSKWDPRKEQPEDYEDEDQVWANEKEEVAVVFDRRVTIHGRLSETLRIFTEGESSTTAYMGGKMVRDYESLTLATDGSCEKNGDRDARAGAGVFVSEGSTLNIAAKLPETVLQSNQTAELMATLLASKGMDRKLANMRTRAI